MITVPGWNFDPYYWTLKREFICGSKYGGLMCQLTYNTYRKHFFIVLTGKKGSTTVKCTNEFIEDTNMYLYILDDLYKRYLKL